MNTLEQLETPALVVDANIMERNIRAMRERAVALDVSFRPHTKTHKCLPIAARTTAGSPTRAIIVSTLKEADLFAAQGYGDILYGVGLSPNKFAHVAALIRGDVELTVVVDNVSVARELATFARANELCVPVLIEIDSDGHRSGVKPGDATLIEVAEALRSPHIAMRGVMTHAGSSYDCRGDSALRAMAEQERAAVVSCAQTLRAARFPCPVVSVGSTPTAVFATDLAGVTELRAGVFVFFDLVMHGLGVCRLEDIALSVLTTVVGHQNDKGWAIVDAGWMALSRDRGTARHSVDQGYGLVCDLDGRPVRDLIVRDANQEHGIVVSRSGSPLRADELPVGSMLRILPNHACATAAQHAAYQVVRGSKNIEAAWPRFSGW
ncbi:MAG: alanine racemase [Gammaproteobacteria bacterium]